jgi:acyl-CoA synthetase (AMP-forming)/AMP-acid ligase II
VSEDGRSYTFAELLEVTQRLAGVLIKRGVRPGDRVVWWADSTIDVVPLYYALAMCGAIFVPLNSRFHAREAAAICDLVDPVLRIADQHHDGEVTIEELLAARAPSLFELPAVSEDDPDVIFCTSGTTGAPKGVVISHRANRLRAESMGQWRAGPTMSMFPHFHWGGWAMIHPALNRGDETVLPRSTDAETLLGTIERHRVASFYAIPGVWRRILEADRSGFDLSSLREANTGTSSTPPEFLRAIAAAFPGTLTWIGYGATEAGSLARLAAEDVPRKPRSVGILTPGFLQRIVDGELWVRGPQLSLGYYRNPEADAAAFVDGWYRTGDLVEHDDEGFLYVVGRAKDMIRTGGEFVAPAEVDVVLQRHPAVLDGAVAGVPHEDWGEIVVAFVVLRSGMTLDLEELRLHCQSVLTPYKHPRELHIVDAISRTGPTGQVQRRRLVETALARSGVGQEISGPAPT